MEGIATIAYASLKAFWRRKNYHRLNANDRTSDCLDDPPISIPETQSQQPKIKNKRRFRIRRTRFKLGRFCFRLRSVKKFFLKMRDFYVNAMMGVGISSPGYGGFVGGGGFAKEYDEKMVVEIYKRIVLAQQQVQGQCLLARKIENEITPVCLFR